MPTFLMLSTIGPEGMATLRQHPQRVLEVNSEVESMGAKIVAQWALLGEYDFATVIEAKDEKTIARVAVTLGARGTMKTRTFVALAVEEFVASVGEH